MGVLLGGKDHTFQGGVSGGEDVSERTTHRFDHRNGQSRMILTTIIKSSTFQSICLLRFSAGLRTMILYMETGGKRAPVTTTVPTSQYHGTECGTTTGRVSSVSYRTVCHSSFFCPETPAMCVTVKIRAVTECE